jgi:enoyl-CoA hydratase
MAKWIKTSNAVKFSVENHIARVTLNRPEKRNAMGPELLRELREALMEADDLVDVSVVVLEGEGKDFCAGYDLAAGYAATLNPEEAARQAAENAKYRQRGSFDDDCWSMERSQEMLSTIGRMHKFVIAKVQGYCLAGGTDLILSCDMVIAADDAKIGFPATRANGTPPTNWWIYHCGPQWAKRMLATGDMLWGKDAARIGLVMDSVPKAQLEEAVMSLAKRMTFVDVGLLTSHKRIVNIAMEVMGGNIMQRLAVEMDARSHTSTGPRRLAFRKDVAEHGLKQALKNRDRPFGDGMVRIGEPQQTFD